MRAETYPVPGPVDEVLAIPRILYDCAGDAVDFFGHHTRPYCFSSSFLGIMDDGEQARLVFRRLSHEERSLIFNPVTVQPYLPAVDDDISLLQLPGIREHMGHYCSLD